MFKLSFVILVSLIFSQAFASSVNMASGEHYLGDEQINGKYTGNRCSVVVNKVEVSQKGLHCFKVNLHIMHQGLKVGADLDLESRVTNYHRSEYPQVKTCAKTTDGRTSTDEIYSSDTTNLMTDIFSGAHKVSRTRYDYHLSLHPADKAPFRTRIHVMKMLSEDDYDCVNLLQI